MPTGIYIRTSNCKQQFIHDHIPWNKGLIGVQLSTRKGKRLSPLSKEHKKKISQSLKGHRGHWLGKGLSTETKNKISIGLKNGLVARNENHYNWKGGISKLPGYYSFLEKRRKIRKRNTVGRHTLKEWLELKVKYNLMCVSCGKVEPKIKLTEDHIIPLAKDGTDSIDNIQPLCIRCNMSKGVKVINYL